MVDIIDEVFQPRIGLANKLPHLPAKAVVVDHVDVMVVQFLPYALKTISEYDEVFPDVLNVNYARR